MSDSVIEERPANLKADDWAERIAAQQRSGMSVKQYCQERGVIKCSFYAWRKRLLGRRPLRLRFALVEQRVRRQERTAEPALKLVLATGERLRIWNWLGHRDAAGRAERLAGMIHLPASVRV
ncbi:MAG: hypothetical protein C5B51_03510 [Terriglobia bacterium]|nr:MAG: hypothetical protein C5B51_03510 [Terriglobia bacterium]